MCRVADWEHGALCEYVECDHGNYTTLCAPCNCNLSHNSSFLLLIYYFEKVNSIKGGVRCMQSVLFPMTVLFLTYLDNDEFVC
jgi:hypothetical protein